jgi:hypothetical protein
MNALLIRLCPCLQTELLGYVVPKGRIVAVNIWGIHHRPSVWSDPSSSRPTLRGEPQLAGAEPEGDIVAALELLAPSPARRRLATAAWRRARLGRRRRTQGRRR